jgi:hypothetical protein
MPIAMLMQFTGVTTGQYDAVMKEMGLLGNAGDWPKGLVGHMAGTTPEAGFCVLDVWDSQADFDSFLQGRLMPAFQKVGGIPEPRVTPIAVHNSYRRS